MPTTDPMRAALDAAYDRLIELWHESDSDKRAHEFMEITEAEYAAWVERSGMWALPLALPSESVAGIVVIDPKLHAPSWPIPEPAARMLGVDIAVGPETTYFRQCMLPEDALSLDVVALCASCGTERGQVTVGQNGPYVSWSFASTGPCACGSSCVRFESRPPT